MGTGVVASPASLRPAKVASFWHTLVVLGVQVVLSARGFIKVGEVRSIANPDRTTMYQHTVFFQWMVFAIVVVGLRLHGTSVYAVLGQRWRSLQQFFEDLAIGFLLLMTSIVVPAILGPHLDAGNSDKAVQFLLPQTGREIAWWVVLSLTAGICEETLFRGYLQQQFTSLTKNAAAGILLSAVLFGAAHGYQGLGKATMIGASALILGSAAYWRKSTRPGMIGHALQDLIGGLIRH